MLEVFLQTWPLKTTECITQAYILNTCQHMTRVRISPTKDVEQVVKHNKAYNTKMVWFCFSVVVLTILAVFKSGPHFNVTISSYQCRKSYDFLISTIGFSILKEDIFVLKQDPGIFPHDVPFLHWHWDNPGWLFCLNMCDQHFCDKFCYQCAIGINMGKTQIWYWYPGPILV